MIGGFVMENQELNLATLVTVCATEEAAISCLETKERLLDIIIIWLIREIA
jgi:hypothetical protein